MIYTTDDLIAAVKRNALIPNSQRKFSDPDFLAILNEELQLMLTGELMKLNEDFFTTVSFVPLVANQSLYEIPSNAAGWRLRDIFWYDTVANTFTAFPRVALDYAERYQFDTADRPTMIVILDSGVGTIPQIGPVASGGLIFAYERLQNKLVLNADCGQVTGIAIVPGGYSMNVTSLPSGYTNGVDVISGTGPHGIIAENDIPVVAPLLVTVTGLFTRPPVVGDWVARTGNTPIAHIPAEYNIVLAQLAALRYCIANGDDKSVATITQSVNAMIQKLRERSLNRVKGAPLKIRPKDRVLNLMRGRMY